MSDLPTYVILGASGGIGSSLTRRLAKSGCQLYLGARSAAPLKSLAAEVDGVAVPVEATVPGSIEAIIQKAFDDTGRLDGVANCIGSLLLKPAHITTDAEWEQTLALNLTTAFAVVRSAAKRMMKSGGSIALCSSAAARAGLANHEAIAAAKAGVIGLTLSAAATYARYGIRVNCVAPGLVRTPLTASLTGSEAMLKASTAMHPLGRIGEPEDVASGLEWFLSPEQRWVTGQVLGIDGGLADLRPPART